MISACATPEFRGTEYPPEPAPPIALADHHGRAWSLTQAHGKVVAPLCLDALHSKSLSNFVVHVRSPRDEHSNGVQNSPVVFLASSFIFSLARHSSFGPFRSTFFVVVDLSPPARQQEGLQGFEGHFQALHYKDALQPGIPQ